MDLELRKAAKTIQRAGLDAIQIVKLFEFTAKDCFELGRHFLTTMHELQSHCEHQLAYVCDQHITGWQCNYCNYWLTHLHRECENYTKNINSNDYTGKCNCKSMCKPSDKKIQRDMQDSLGNIKNLVLKEDGYYYIAIPKEVRSQT